MSSLSNNGNPDSNAGGPNATDSQRPYTSLINLNGSFDLPIKDLSSTKKNDETTSMIVNVGKRPKKSKKSDKSYNKPTNPDIEELERNSM